MSHDNPTAQETEDHYQERAMESDHADREQCPVCGEGLGATADLARLQARVGELDAALRQTHANYCTAAWTDRGLHAPECLLYEVDSPEAAP